MLKRCCSRLPRVEGLYGSVQVYELRFVGLVVKLCAILLCESVLAVKLL